MYCLEVVSEAPRGSASYYSLCVRQPYVVGRSDTCDIVLNSQDVSRLHASLQVVLSSNVEYSYARGGAQPYRPAVGGSPSPPRSASNGSPLIGLDLPDDGTDESEQLPNQPPLALVVTNQSKFGVSVDGTVVSGSCVIPNGGVVCFGSVGLRATYRPLVVSINPECYDAPHRSEMEDMLRQLGAFITSQPGAESEALETYAHAADSHTKHAQMVLGAGYGSSSTHHGLPQRSGSTPTGGTRTPPRNFIGDSSNVTPTSPFADSFPLRQNTNNNGSIAGANQSRSSVAESRAVAEKMRMPIRPLGCLYVTEVIDASDTTVDAMLHGHSMVLPAYVFELFAALADRCAKPLHTLPKPADFEPPKSVEVYSGTAYVRPEPRSVPFSLFAPSGNHVASTSRRAMLQHRMFTIQNEALCDKLAPVLQACGAVVVPWSGALDFTRYEVHGDDDPSALPKDPDEEDYYEAVGLSPKPRFTDDGELIDDAKDTGVSSSPHFRERRTMLSRFKDRRYVIATRGELLALRDETITMEPPPEAPEAEHRVYNSIAALREDWFLMAKSGWTVLSHTCILRALLGNRFVPMPELPTEPEQYNDHLTPSRDGDDGSDDGDVLAAPLASQLFSKSAGEHAAEDVDSDATPSDLGSEAEGPLRTALRHLSTKDGEVETSRHLTPRASSPLGTSRASPPKNGGGATPTKNKSRDQPVSKTPTSASRTVHNPQNFPGAPAQAVEAWVTAQKLTTNSAAARSAQSFDIRLHRLQVVVDRTIVVLRDRVKEVASRYEEKAKARNAPSQQRKTTVIRTELQYNLPGALSPGAKTRPAVPAAGASLAFLRNVVDKTSAHLAELENLSQQPEGESRAIAIQQQWDAVEATREAAHNAIDYIVQEAGPELTREARAAHREMQDTAARVERSGRPGVFRGQTTRADRHFMPAQDPEGDKQRAAGSTRRARSAGASSRPLGGTRPRTRSPSSSVASSYATSSRAAGTSHRSLAGSDFVTGGRQQPAGSSSGMVTPTPAEGRGLRDRTRWARYHPAAPVQSLATPHARAGSPAGGAGGGAGGAGGASSSSTRKAHSALLIHISPMDLPRISRHRRLFVTKFGAQEGEVRFNMWLSSQTPQWSAAFFEALEAKDQTLGDFIRASV